MNYSFSFPTGSGHFTFQSRSNQRNSNVQQTNPFNPFLQTPYSLQNSFFDNILTFASIFE